MTLPPTSQERAQAEFLRGKLSWRYLSWRVPVAIGCLLVLASWWVVTP